MPATPDFVPRPQHHLLNIKISAKSTLVTVPPYVTRQNYKNGYYWMFQNWIQNNQLFTTAFLDYRRTAFESPHLSFHLGERLPSAIFGSSQGRLYTNKWTQKDDHKITSDPLLYLVQTKKKSSQYHFRSFALSCAKHKMSQYHFRSFAPSNSLQNTKCHNITSDPLQYLISACRLQVFHPFFDV